MSARCSKEYKYRLVLVESGIPPVRHVVSKLRCKYLTSKLAVNDDEQPFIFAYRLCRDNNTPEYRHMLKYLTYDLTKNPFDSLFNDINNRSINASKFLTYVQELNLTMDLHPIYTSNMYVPDYLRESFSRIRLMSHNLKIETGRWSRIPRESRVCRCDNAKIQTESHALIECTLTCNIRARYPMLNFRDNNSLLGEVTHLYEMCKNVNEV